MIKVIKIYSSFSVPDLDKAKEFYGSILNLAVNQRLEGLDLKIGNDNNVFIYYSPNNKPADFTVLNLVVDDVELVVDELIGKGLTMEQYNMPGLKTDNKGLVRSEREGGMGPHVVAWFKDPAGNIIALSQKAK